MHRRFTQPVVERTSAVRLAAVGDRVYAQRSQDRREPSDVVAVARLLVRQKPPMAVLHGTATPPVPSC